mgnify:CR=1 FL=1
MHGHGPLGTNVTSQGKVLAARVGIRQPAAGSSAPAHLLLQLQSWEGVVRRQQRRVKGARQGLAGGGMPGDDAGCAVVGHKVLPQVGGNLHHVLVHSEAGVR